MALTKAAKRSHPAAPVKAPSSGPAPGGAGQAGAETVRPVGGGGGVPAKAVPAMPSRAVEQATPAEVTRLRQVPDRAPERPDDLAVPRERRAAATAASTGSEKKPRSARYRREKREVAFKWAAEDMDRLMAVFRQARGEYRRIHQDDERPHNLTISQFTATAIKVAAEHEAAWIGSVRNDARLEPMPGGRADAKFVWPRQTAEWLEDSWERLDAETSTPGFRYTKAHLAAAAVMWALDSVGEWLPQVPNDDRRAAPTPGDGRLTPRRGLAPSDT